MWLNRMESKWEKYRKCSNRSNRSWQIAGARATYCRGKSERETYPGIRATDCRGSRQSRGRGGPCGAQLPFGAGPSSTVTDAAPTGNRPTVSKRSMHACMHDRCPNASGADCLIRLKRAQSSDGWRTRNRPHCNLLSDLSPSGRCVVSYNRSSRCSVFRSYPAVNSKRGYWGDMIDRQMDAPPPGKRARLRM
jgi:hypothetical protein